MRRRLCQRTFPAALALLLLAACGSRAVNPVTGRAERSVMEEATEIAEGRKAQPQVLAEYGAPVNPRLQACINEVGQKLARQSHRSQLQWTFSVLDSPAINALALPGGFFYITRGLMAYLDSEAELAGVIGLEIGHVTAGHGPQQATWQHTVGLGVLAATVLGVECLVRNRYNPLHRVEVIQVLKSQQRCAADQARAEGRALPAGANGLASHPGNGKRLAELRQVAATCTGNHADDGRARYLQVIKGMACGEGSEPGITRRRSSGCSMAVTVAGLSPKWAQSSRWCSERAWPKPSRAHAGSPVRHRASSYARFA